MTSGGLVLLCRTALVACLLAPMGLADPAKGQVPPEAPAPAAAPPLVEAFQKGPIAINAQVTRSLASGESVRLPLFQVPVLAFKDRLELSFAGEAFDRRVTDAEWSAIVVFLPRTVAPTDQGVVDFRLAAKDGRMVVPPIQVPYDSVPMIFLVPDRNGRKKVLKDLNDHLASFRTLCAKISDISTERAAADKFLQDLDGIDKNLSPAQYDNALQGFLHAYGDPVSSDLQGFLGTSRSNLEKCQFLTQEFRNTSLLVPPTGGSAPVTAQVSVGAGGGHPVSAYVSILFDLAAIINNLWPGHQFQYLPAVARNFRGTGADLYYSDWIHTTGEVRGALMCCPGKWEDQAVPAFDLELAPGESLLRRQALLRVRPRDKERTPFALYGHDWKLLLTGARGEQLAPVPLAASPNRQAFVASPGASLAALRKQGGSRLKARVVGRWGFTSIALDPIDLELGVDPAWAPSAAEAAAFQVGQACRFRLPGSWAGNLDQVAFQPSAKGGAILSARLTDLPDGDREAEFHPGPGDAGPGLLELRAIGSGRPDLGLPITLLAAKPEVTGLEARAGATSIRLQGRYLQGVEAVEVDGRRFQPVNGKSGADAAGRVFESMDGKALEGSPGKKSPACLVLPDAQRVPLAPVVLLAPRPRIAEARLIPVAAKPSGPSLRASVPIAATSEPVRVDLFTAKGYRFPADGGFRVALRNAEDPSVTRAIQSGNIHVLGHDQKAAFAVTPSELLGGMASGRLEVQVQDDHAGASDWMPLPTTFLDLPAIGSVQGTVTGFRLTGASLDLIEAVAASPAGPWERAAIAIEDGREVAEFTLHLTDNKCYLKLYGWEEVPLALSFPGSAAARPDLPAVVPPVPAVASGVPVAVPGPSGTGNISP
jgi:hypothetical protein